MMKLLLPALCSASVLLESLRRDGFAVIRDFSPPEERSAMRERIGELLQKTSKGERVVFRTDDAQTEAQSKSRHFFESGDRVHFFDEVNGGVNKAGHGLHLQQDIFGDYSRSPKIRKVLDDLGFHRPVVPQSMYIFKSAFSGGPVTPHADATFLRTLPKQTVVGLWLAIDDADEENGCLWVRNGSHTEPLRRYFIRRNTSSSSSEDDHLTMIFQDVDKLDDGARLDDRWLLVPSSSSSQEESSSSFVTTSWEGVDIDKGTARDVGFTPVPVSAGSLVILTGTLDHLSLPNTSPRDRHTFQLHVVESMDRLWATSNWLQPSQGFLPLWEEDRNTSECPTR